MTLLRGDLEPSREHPHVPGPSLWPVGFAVGVVVLLVGIVVSWTITGIGAIIAALFAFLWVRDVARSTGLTEAPEVEPETRAGRPAESPSPPPEPVVVPPDRYSRSVFLELSTLGLGGVIGGLVTVPALGFMIGPAFLKQGEKPRPRPGQRLPGGRVRDRHVHGRPEAGLRLPPHRVRPQQRPARQPAELHDHLQPLRASRLPGAAERRSPAQEAVAVQGRDPDPRPAVGLRLPVPRRPVRHRGQSHRRARRCARSTGTRSRSATGICSSASRSRSPVSTAPGRPRRSTSGRSRSRASTSPGSSRGCTRSSLPTDGPACWPSLGAASHPGADHVSARLARGALGPRRRGPLLPLPERAGRHQLVPDARLGDADRLPRPGGDRRRARDVLQAGPEHRLPVDPAHHERCLGRLARPRHALAGARRSSSS